METTMQLTDNIETPLPGSNRHYLTIYNLQRKGLNIQSEAKFGWKKIERQNCQGFFASLILQTLQKILIKYKEALNVKSVSIKI